MRNLTSAVLIVTVVMAGILRPRTEVAGEESQAQPPVVGWAITRFEAAGLRLPPVDIRLSPDRNDCQGHPGLAVTGGETSVVTLCLATDSYPVVWKKTILHELGHVWTHANLGPAERAAFMEERDCGSWNDAETVWERRGSEQAAEVIAWALMDRDLLMVTLDDHDPGSLADAYLTLTGRRPPPRELGGVHVDGLASRP